MQGYLDVVTGARVVKKRESREKRAARERRKEPFCKAEVWSVPLVWNQFPLTGSVVAAQQRDRDGPEAEEGDGVDTLLFLTGSVSHQKRG